MSITPLNIGSAANDGTGQDLRSGGQVINDNFAELDQRTATAQATADAKVDKETGKGLSTEDFTTGEKAKLAGLQPAHYRGTFTTLVALQAGVSVPIAGDYGDVDAGVGSDVQRYIWDASDSKWVLQGASGGGPDNTDSLPEGTTNLYFSAVRVRSAVLTGLSLVSGVAVVATDTVLAAVGKLQKQITDLVASVATKAGKGANTDITSLGGITTPLSQAQGGTGNSTGLAPAATKLATARTINGVAFDGTGNIAVTDSTKEAAITSGAATQYWTGLKTWASFAQSVLVSALSGLSTTAGGVVVDTDTVIGAFGKLQRQVSDLVTAVGGKSSLGVGQVWVEVTSTRALSTTYTNDTGKPIQVSIFGGPASANNVGYILTVDLVGIRFTYTNSGLFTSAANIIIPAGSTYRVVATNGNLPLYGWWELR